MNSRTFAPNFILMNLFVAGLPYDMDNQELQEIFEEFGTVNSARIILDKETRRSRGFGFVEMPDSAEAEKAISGLNGSSIDDRTIAVKEAEDRGNNNGGGNRGGGFRRENSGGGYNRGGGGYNNDRNRY